MARKIEARRQHSRSALQRRCSTSSTSPPIERHEREYSSFPQSVVDEFTVEGRDTWEKREDVEQAAMRKEKMAAEKG